MTTKLSRDEAISKLARAVCATLAFEEREYLVLEMWSTQEGELGYDTLSASLRAEMSGSEAPPRSVTDPDYDALALIALRMKFEGVKNSYLESRLTSEFGGFFEVSGTEDHLEPCPCCHYRTLSRRGEYDICPVCFWEDNGVNDPNFYSGPNHMTLQEGRDNFVRVGAVSEAHVCHVDKHGRDKYILE